MVSVRIRGRALTSGTTLIWKRALGRARLPVHALVQRLYGGDHDLAAGRALVSLAKAGADIGIFASNTPHLVFNDIRQRSPIPLVSIVEAACDAARSLGIGRVGLFGTRFTMQARFYPEVFAKHGIAVVVPNAVEQDDIHDRYMSELVQGVYRAETRGRLLEIVDRLKERENIEGLILGGTELPLLFRNEPETEIPLLNTTELHAQRAIDAVFA